MLKRINYVFIAVLTFIYAFCMNVNAASSATMSWSGTGSVNTGKTFTVDIVASDSTGGGALMSAGGVITSSDTSCISFVSVTKVASGTTNGNKFAYSDMDGSTSGFTIARATFKAGSSACSTNINITQPKLAFTDSTKLSPSTISKRITVAASTPETPKSSVKTLKSLVPSKGSLSPAFASGTTSYTINLTDDVSSITFNATPTDSKATVSGTTCSLNSSSTVCKVVVKAEDGTTQTYSVTVNKKTTQEEKKSSDATLKSLDVSGYTLSPKFSKNTTTYSMTVKNNIASLKVDAVPTDSKAKVTITGNSNWKVGVNPIKIKVTAEDGTTKVYTVNVTRKADTSKTSSDPKTDDEDEKSNDSYLKDIIISDGIISPKFDKNKTEYSITVPYEVTKLNLDYVKSNDKATVKVRGNSDFKVGEVNTVTIDVTAEDGSLRTYTINVTRSDKKSNNDLEDIIIEDGDLDPDFDPDKTEYTVDIPGDKDKINIKAITNNSKAKVQILGNDNLKEGKNKISIIVTDENGFSKIYTVYAYKKVNKKLFNFSLIEWLLLLGLLLAIIFLIILLFKRRKKEEKKEEKQTIIEFKPEFNFSSKNGTDDDIVEEGGVLNQYSESPVANNTKEKEETKEVKEVKVVPPDADVKYDLYDDVVTKDELIDAIKIAKETNDSSILDMLLEQEELNRKKEDLKNNETKKSKKTK